MPQLGRFLAEKLSALKTNLLNVAEISVIELAAVALAILYLILAAARNIFCWLAAGISSILYIKICYNSHLFIETGLQFFYLLMAIVGYFHWKKNNVQNEDDISLLTVRGFIVGTLICGILSLMMAYYFDRFTTAALPWLDAPITVFSIWATWLVIKKKLENWLFWVLIDALAIYLYYKRNLHLTALLYAMYTILAVVGYYKWRSVYNTYKK
jgi:nicotinamide mononucleotide transporter